MEYRKDFYDQGYKSIKNWLGEDILIDVKFFIEAIDKMAEQYYPHKIDKLTDSVCI